jgi:serine/threonine protein kinase
MALVGKSLDKLIEAAPGRKFSPGTAIGISIQLLNALRAMHTIGYLHRDIKVGRTSLHFHNLHSFNSFSACERNNRPTR